MRQNARSVIAAANVTEPPVNLLSLATLFRDDLTVRAHDLKGVADGLLRWNGSRQRFFLYYQPDKYRQRFNLAHELSHYLLPEHCRAIRARFQHYSKSGFVSQSRIEREADIHASELLIPAMLLSGEEEPCLADVDRMVATFDTSFQCAARRLIDVCDPPAAMVVSHEGKVLWGFANEAFKEVCGNELWKGKRVPAGSCAARIVAGAPDLADNGNISDWFDSDVDQHVWEEARHFTESGHVLTIMSI